MEDSMLVKGVIVDKDFSHPQMPKVITYYLRNLIGYFHDKPSALGFSCMLGTSCFYCINPATQPHAAQMQSAEAGAEHKQEVPSVQ